MAMASGSNKGLENEINVTPMIDVLLVLLIIFMAALPNMRKAIAIQLPHPNPQHAPARHAPRPDPATAAGGAADQADRAGGPARAHVLDQYGKGGQGATRSAPQGDL